MAAVAAPPPPPSVAGPSINRPPSATSDMNRSASATSKKETSPVPVVTVIPEEIEAVETKDEKPSSPKPTSRSASPVVPNRPPIRPIPAVRSKFDLEPNPFEQSFRESHHSDSLDDVNESSGATPPRGGDATAIKHNALPPLSSLTSPAAADPSQFPWLANQGLRTGPLSPAMLAGPQGAARKTGGDGEHNAFDSSTFRTGFTPGTGSGFTPGFTSLMGGAGFSNLPLPSPNTAAFLNMVTNATPTEGEATEQQNGQHNPHQPPSAIPPHMQHHGLSHIANHNDGQDTITPNTLSALTGVVNDMNRQMNGQHPQPNFYHQQQQQQQQQHQQHQRPPPPANGNGSHGPPGPPGPGYPHVDYAQQSANAASQAANGLFLLSQAHQELSKRDEEVRGPGAGPGGPPAQGPPPMNIPGMGGMAPGAAHGHNMMYPGHPGYMSQPPPGLGGHPIPSASLVQHYQQQQQPIHPPLPGQNGPQSSIMGKRNSTGPGPSAATLVSAAATILGAGQPPPPAPAPPAPASAAAPPAAGGRKRKSDAADTATTGGKAKKGKKGANAASPAADKGMKGESTSPMGYGGMRGMGLMDDMDDEDMESNDGISKITGKPETEEEKRKNFLERNRQAALKCRQRKKQWLNELQSKVEQLQLENDRLNQTVAGLHDEIGRLSGVLIQHRDCGLGLPTGYGRGPMR